MDLRCLGPIIADSARALVANPATPPDHLFQLADALDELRTLLLQDADQCSAELGRASIALRRLAVQRHLARLPT